jgi:hypothetical protein
LPESLSKLKPAKHITEDSVTKKAGNKARNFAESLIERLEQQNETAEERVAKIMATADRAIMAEHN